VTLESTANTKKKVKMGKKSSGLIMSFRVYNEIKSMLSKLA
jgi:hypothetical protein